MIGNIAPFAHSNGNILLLLLLLSIIIIIIIIICHQASFTIIASYNCKPPEQFKVLCLFSFWIIFVACGNSQLFTIPPLVCFLRKQKFHADVTSLPRYKLAMGHQFGISAII